MHHLFQFDIKKVSNNQSKFCLLHLQCVFLKILLPTLHKFFKKFHMIYTFLPQLSKNQSVECSRLVSKYKKTSREKLSSNGVLWFVIPLIQIHVDTFGPFWCFIRKSQLSCELVTARAHPQLAPSLPQAHPKLNPSLTQARHKLLNLSKTQLNPNLYLI